MTRSQQIRSIWPALTTTAIALCVTLFLAASTGGQLGLILSRLTIEGAVLLAWMAGAAGFGAGLLGLLRFRPSHAAMYFSVSFGLGLGLLSLVVLILGLVGVVGTWVYWGLLAGGWVIGAFLLRGKPVAEPSMAENGVEQSPESKWPLLWCAGVGGVLLGIALWLALFPTGLLWPGEPNRYDVLAYHFQIPREWWEAGRIFPLQHNVFSYMPLGVEMHYLMAMGLMADAWTASYVAQLMHVAMFTVAALSLYSALRPSGRTGGAIAMLALAGCPYVLLLAPVGYNEGGMVLYLALMMAVLFDTVGRHASSRSPVNDWKRGWGGGMVIGLLGGFAVGVKLTALPMVVGAVAVAMVVLAATRRIPWSSLATAALGCLLAASPWLIRTASWTGGNPVFPLAASKLGSAHWTPEQVARFEKAHAPRPDQQSPSGRVEALWNQVGSAPEFGWRGVTLPMVAVAVGMVALLIAILRRKEASSWGTVEVASLLLMVLVVAAVWLFATHLQGRFFAPGIVVCALLLGVAPAPVRLPLMVAVTALGVWSVSLALGRLSFLNDPQGQLQGQVVGIDYRAFEQAVRPEPLRGLSDDVTLTLIGDAMAYRFIRPAGKLKYTCVFDVAGADPVAGWRAAPTDWLWVDPSELRRLASTYKTPPAPPEWARPEPFLVRPQAAP